MDFDPRNNVWEAEDGRLFSSARMAPIDRDDPELVAWLEAGGAITTWPTKNGEQTEEAIVEVVAYYDGPGTATSTPPDITPRQFATGLWTDKVITFAECDAYVAVRTIPPALQAILDALPDDETGDPTPRKDATLLLRGATTFRFDHPLVDTIREAQGWTAQHLIDRWTAWAAL